MMSATDATVTLLVVAKSPEPGKAKTRLCPPLTPHQAAAVAAAALLDTLDVVAAAAQRLGSRPVLALSGDLSRGAAPDALLRAVDAFTVVPQRGDGFADRLVSAHTDAAGPHGATVQIGMDTPQVDPDHLVGAAETISAPDGPGAVLGPAADGGWWLLGLRRAADAQLIRPVPMSRPDTGEQTLAALRDSGLRVDLVEELHDVDDHDDLSTVARSAPRTRFARLVGVLASADDADPTPSAWMQLS